MFSTVSYMSRDKYLSSNDKIHSAFVQETQVEMVLDEAAEGTFQDHLKPDQNEKETGTSIRERIISPTDKVISFQTTLDQTTKPKKDYSLGFVFPGNCVEIHKKSKRFSKKKWRRIAKLQLRSKHVSRIARLELFFAIRKSLEQLSQKQNFNKIKQQSSVYRGLIKYI